MPFKKHLNRMIWILNQFGFDPLRLLYSLRGSLKYMSDWQRFRRGYTGTIGLTPCLHDRFEEGGATNNEYFWQDLLVARWIHEAEPLKHVDIGSRVDGFVAHIASFREIEVFDVRPVTTRIPGVSFTLADMMESNNIKSLIVGGGYCDSLSCLHALEHFGLGRYGDPIDPGGYQHGLANMAQLLRPGGTFYLSTPIGQERVEFNANWVFDPRNILSCCENVGMKLKKLTIITSIDGPQEYAVDAETLAELALQRYQLGLFTFTKAIQ